MRSDWQEYTGYGELLCFVLAWMVGVAAVWQDYAGRNQSGDGNVAISSGERSATDRLD